MNKLNQMYVLKIIFFMLLSLNILICLVFGFERKEQANKITELNNQITELNNQIHTIQEIQLTHTQILEGQALSSEVMEYETAIFMEEEKQDDEQEEVVESMVLTDTQTIDKYIYEISAAYNIEPELIQSIVWHESRYDPNTTNGLCLGLMQVSTKWHWDRAERLGVTDFYDAHSSILLGVDYISELINKYKDPALALMMYNMSHDKAKALYMAGEISGYASSVLERAEQIKQGVIQ